MKRMLKRTLVLFVLLTAVILFLVPAAFATHKSGYYSFEVSDGTAVITGVDTVTSGDVVIPETIGGYTVTEIADFAFFGCDNIVSVTLPEMLSAIGEKAFYNCNNLSQIRVSQNSRYFSNDENGVLFNKDKTTLIRCPVGYADDEYTIPDSVTMVTAGAFSDCSNIAVVNIGNNMTEISDGLFQNCSALKKIVIPDGITFIGEKAFNGCSNLTQIHIPKSVTLIGEMAFGENKKITDIFVDGGNEYYSSLNGVLYNKDKTILLKYTSGREDDSFTVAETVNEIGNAAFECSENLTEVILPDKLKTIGKSAFFGCRYIKDFVIPDSVSYIGECAFSSCTSLVSIRIPDGVASLKDSSFANCTSLTYVEIADSVELIESCAFSECDSLTSIILPVNLKTIESVAFYGCDNLTDVLIPRMIISIGSGAFEMCDKLERVHFTGTADNWDNIDIEDENGKLSKTQVHFVKSTEKENPTCTQNGYEAGIHCSDCNLWIDGHEEISALGHSWGDGKIHTASTCKTKGVRVYVCNNDSTHKKTELLKLNTNNHEGKIISYDEVPASCTKSGYTAGKYCSGCEKWINGHETIPKSKHKYVSSVTKEATCTQDGLITFTCACKDVYTTVVPAKGHKYSSSYTIDKKSTCKTSGSKSRHCTVKSCNAKTDITTIKKQTHNIVVLAEKKATCTASGLTQGKKCKTCGTVTVAQKTIAKLRHTEIVLPGKDATCTEKGLTQGKKCKNCGKVTSEQKTIEKQSHTYITVTEKARLTKDGSAVTKCITCQKINKSEKIYSPKVINLTKNSYVYDNNIKTPGVIVKDRKGNTLKKNNDYDLSYEKGRKAPGKYTVKITFKGKYAGEAKLYFTIRPKATTKISATQTSTTITLKWNKVTGADGYIVYVYNKSSKKYVKLKELKNTTYKISKLKVNTKYKYKIRAFKKDYGTIFGEFSSPFVTSTGPAKPKIKVKSLEKGKAVISWNKVSGAYAYQLYYSTDKTDGYVRVNSYKADVRKTTKHKLKSGKVYYFKLRVSKKLSDSFVYSSWSDVVKVKIK